MSLDIKLKNSSIGELTTIGQVATLRTNEKFMDGDITLIDSTDLYNGEIDEEITDPTKLTMEYDWSTE